VYVLETKIVVVLEQCVYIKLYEKESMVQEHCRRKFLLQFWIYACLVKSVNGF
jgi:hypothetical protein